MSSDRTVIAVLRFAVALLLTAAIGAGGVFIQLFIVNWGDVLSWDHCFCAGGEDVKFIILTAVTWFSAIAVVGGVVAGRWMLRRANPSPSRRSNLSGLALVVAASSAGALTGTPLVAHYARMADVNEIQGPMYVESAVQQFIVGTVLGAAVSVLVLLSQAVAVNLALTTVWYWVALLVSAELANHATLGEFEKFFELFGLTGSILGVAAADGWEVATLAVGTAVLFAALSALVLYPTSRKFAVAIFFGLASALAAAIYEIPYFGTLISILVIGGFVVMVLGAAGSAWAVRHESSRLVAAYAAVSGPVLVAMAYMSVGTGAGDHIGQSFPYSIALFSIPLAVLAGTLGSWIGYSTAPHGGRYEKISRPQEGSHSGLVRRS